MRRQGDGRILVELAFDRCVAVHPHRAAVHDSCNLLLPRRFENHLRPVHVDPVGANRVGDDVADVGDGGEVDDGVAAAHRAPRCFPVREVADHGRDVLARMMRRVNEVEDDRFVAVGVQRVDDVRADEARPARHEHFHCEAASRAGRSAGR